MLWLQQRAANKCLPKGKVR